MSECQSNQARKVVKGAEGDRCKQANMNTEEPCEENARRARAATGHMGNGATMRKQRMERTYLCR